MKKYFILFITILFVSCVPSNDAIQNAIYQTQTADITPIKKIATISPTNTYMPKCDISSDLKSNWATTLCDTFENDNSNWYVGVDDSDLAIVDVSISDGQYIIDVKGKPHSGYMSGVIQWFGIAEAKDFMVSIDGTITSKNRGVLWGFNFRGKDKSFYSFGIGKEGWYRLDMLKNGDWYYLINTKANNAIKWDETNNLSIIVEENKFFFYVNDILIDTYESDLIFGNEISLFINVDEGASATFIFDNALVRAN